MAIRDDILSLFEKPALDTEARAIFIQFRDLLSNGKIRAAEFDGQNWHVNDWVKKGILLGFRLGQLTDFSINETFRFFDKDTFPPKKFELTDKIRQVPGGSTIREGAYVAPGVVIMPPAFINVGAYIDAAAMVDSHALVGSCAQIGKGVHLSAGAQIGGVLEPIGAMPVIIEDGVLIGGNCGVYEGAIVKSNAVLAAGVILTGGTAVYDLVTERILRKTADSPLIIPPGAVVVPGSRPAKGEFAREHGLSIATPLIIKYRDDKTDAATALETALR